MTGVAGQRAASASSSSAISASDTAVVASGAPTRADAGRAQPPSSSRGTRQGPSQWGFDSTIQCVVVDGAAERIAPTDRAAQPRPCAGDTDGEAPHAPAS